MLNKQKGNMYEFITHTWNTIKGECPHGCSYCYMKSWGKQKPLHFDEKELKTDLGKDNFIFVGSSCDMFAGNIKTEWINNTIEHCKKFDNRYLFQTKCPSSYKWFDFPEKTVLGTTIETNRYYKELYNENTPPPEYRAYSIGIAGQRYPTMITIEPIMDFDLDEFVEMLTEANPTWINIGADSQKHNLPEPSPEKVKQLIEALQCTEIKLKKNLNRIASV